MRLILEGVGHAYGETKVLSDIGFDLTDGEIVCIIGPSGCGKSTLLRFLGGLEKPDRGRILISGEPPAGSLNPLTYIFQDFALLPWRTVEGNVSLVLEDHRISAAEARAIIADVLARTKLSDFAKAWPRQLSGGMKQRVAIARALAVRPAIMLMDEPLSALDSQTRELLMDDLVELWLRERFSACYVTHNLAEAVRLGHKIVVLSRRPGRIREIVEIDMPLNERADHPGELETDAAPALGNDARGSAGGRHGACRCLTMRFPARPIRSGGSRRRTVDARPVPFRGGGFQHRHIRFLSPIVFILLLVLWQIGSQTGFISNIALPAPADVAKALSDLVRTGMLWKHLSVSLYRLILGWTLGSLLGVGFGLAIGLFSVARVGLLPLVSALFPVPKIALLPLFIIWFGIGEGSKVATILFGTFFPTVISTYSGVDNVDRNLIRMGQSFGLSWLSIVRKIIVPGGDALDPVRLPHLRLDRHRAARRSRDDRRAVRHRRLHPDGRLAVRPRPADRRRRHPVGHRPHRRLAHRPPGAAHPRLADLTGRRPTGFVFPAWPLRVIRMARVRRGP